MIDVLINLPEINSDALDETLRATFTDKIIGVSSGAYGVIVHLEDSATQAEILQVESLVLTHDPSVLSPHQQAVETRQQQLEQDRITNLVPLDLDDFLLQLPLIRLLASKVAWLEREIRDLRDLE